MVCRPQRAEPDYDTGTKNVADLIRVWGDVRFSNPATISGEVDWDKAFLEHVLGARAASNDAEFFAVVDSMLSRLGDPATFLLPNMQPEALRSGLLYWWSRGRLYIDFGSGSSYTDKEIHQLVGEVRKANEIVFDLRKLQSSLLYVDYAMKIIGPSLIASKVALPIEKLYLHRGFKPAEPGSLFETSSEQELGEILVPIDQVRRKRVVVVVDGTTRLPSILVPLWHEGVASIASSTKSIHEAFQPVKSVAIRNRELRVRTGNTLYKSRPLAIKPDVVDSIDPMNAVDRLFGQAPSSKPLAEPDSVQSQVSRPDKSQNEVGELQPELTYLAIARVWNVIRIFYPYRELIGDWNRVLPEFVGLAGKVNHWDDYVKLLSRLGARTHDDHTGWRGEKYTRVFGNKRAPFRIRILRGAVVVTEIANSASVPGLEVGDVLLAIEGVKTRELYRQFSSFVAASRPIGTQVFALSRALRADTGSVKSMVFEGANGERKTIDVKFSSRIPTKAKEAKPFRVIEEGIGYVDLRELTVSQIGEMLDGLGRTKAIILDMRGYPRGTFVKLAPRLTQRKGKLPITLIEVPHIRSSNDFNDPPEAHRYVQRLEESPKARYAGQTVMLIDESAVSQSEHSGLAYKMANGTTFIGTKTAGANGNVTTVSVPGGLTMSFTGLGVRHVDGRQLQRVGLIPDVRVEPTLGGIRQGKDEVLDAALDYLRKATSN